MDIEIRPGTADELERIIDTIYEEFSLPGGYGSKEEVLKDYEYFFEQPERSVLSAYVDGEFAGFTLYNRVKDSRSRLYLNMLPTVSDAMDKEGLLGKILTAGLGHQFDPWEHSIPRPQDRDFYKDTTVVFPEFRKMGIGVLLTQKIQDFARRRNKSIYTFALDDSGSLEMNLKAGFQPMLRIQVAYEDGRGGILLGWRDQASS